MKRTKEPAILAASNRLFLQNGYEATTMRQIAEAADVSLGLATYHFKSKRLIAVEILVTYLRELRRRIDELISPAQDPLLHSAVMVRISIEFFSAPRFRRFYLETLRADIYAESIQRLGNRAMNAIAERFGIDLTTDLLLLFDNYIPPSVERILFLEKEKGNFPNIAYDDIPDIVFSVTVERHLDQKSIAEAAREARAITTRALAALPEDLSERLFSCMEEG